MNKARDSKWHMQIYDKVKEIVKGEPPLQPFSDRAITEILTLVENEKDVTQSIVKTKRIEADIPTSIVRRKQNHYALLRRT